MEQKALRKILWEDAGKAGLALGGFSTAYLFLTQFLGKIQLPAFAATLISAVLWAVKFGGCIWLMMLFMKMFASKNSAVDNRTTYRFGLAVAFLSALVYAAACFANTAFISADMINENIKLMMEQMAPMMDSNTMNKVDETMEKLPQITFFSNLIYCFLYGTILSFILSRNIPSRNPFADRTSDEW